MSKTVFVVECCTYHGPTRRRRWNRVHTGVSRAECLAYIDKEVARVPAESLFGLTQDRYRETFRVRGVRPVVKPSVQVQANEKPQSVPAPTPSTGLHLLGVLGKGRGGQAGSVAACTVRPMPPVIGAQGQWPLANNSDLQVLQACAKLPATSLLVLHPEHRQAGAFCADSRAFRFGGVI